MVSLSELWVAIDVGGTFTDLVVLDPVGGRIVVNKVPSTPPHYSQGVLDVLDGVTEDCESINLFLHGATVHVNALLERKGVRSALVTTAGFGDVYAMRRGNRTRPYDLHFRYPTPLIPRSRIFEVDERLDAAGNILAPLDVSGLDPIIERVLAEGIQSVAVCFLHSYLNPVHELAACDYINSKAPQLFVTPSFRVCQEWREYERTSTVVMNAYVSPILQRYLDDLQQVLSERGFGRRIYVMRSNGGLASAEESGETAVLSLMSGPIGGNVAGKALSKETGRPNLICIDMGGTSFETSLIVDGESAVVTSKEVSGFPVQAPVVDIHTIGAGGGSIAWNDAGMLRVGPQSAGAVPGPACYQRGGADATVTDANLVLGRLNPDRPFAGNVELNLGLAQEAVGRVAADFGLSLMEAAEGIVSIANENMANAIRTMTINRGIDPRDFALVAYGGAGPMHAAPIAESLGVRTIVIPKAAGAFSAWGMLETSIRHDLAANFVTPLASIDRAAAERRLNELEGALRDQVGAEGVQTSSITFSRFIDVRYVGQAYTLMLPLPSGQSFEEIEPDEIKALFDDTYERTYGHKNPAEAAEVTSLRVTAEGPLQNREGNPVRSVSDAGAAGPGQAPAGVATSEGAATGADDRVGGTPTVEKRLAVFDGAEYEVSFVERRELQVGDVLDGPVVVEEQSCTTIVPPGFQLSLDQAENLIITRKEAVA